jgi:hypothetical protein
MAQETGEAAAGLERSRVVASCLACRHDDLLMRQELAAASSRLCAIAISPLWIERDRLGTVIPFAPFLPNRQLAHGPQNCAPVEPPPIHQ